MKKKLHKILACPSCHGPLAYHKGNKQLICKLENLIYPVRNGIPVLLSADAKKYDSDK